MNTLLMEMHLERKAGKNPTDRAWWYLPFRDREGRRSLGNREGRGQRGGLRTVRKQPGNCEKRKG